MIKGDSPFHVEQGVGNFFNPHHLQGYFNDLTKKVTCPSDIVSGLPVVPTLSGDRIHFSIAIFQYGLGCHDLLLERKSEDLDYKFRLTLDWAVSTLDELGRWETFSFIYPENPYSAMAQGQGISLLLRGFQYYGETRYSEAAKKAVEFLLKPVKDGGVCYYDGKGGLIFKEYTHKATVLNGWIFAYFGLFDYCLVFPEEKRMNTIRTKALTSLLGSLNNFDNNYWSFYNDKGLIASGFYHKLHIAQLKALLVAHEDETLRVIIRNFEEYERNIFAKLYAFMVKVIQKIVKINRK